MNNIGLFPIKNILFPYSVLPVHIFEKRYIKLIKESIDKNIPFGINLKKSGEIYEIGCLAKVNKIINVYNDGRMDILIQGNDRYKILKKDLSSAGYYTAIINSFEDEESEFDKRLFKKCVDSYNTLVGMVDISEMKKIENYNINLPKPSFFLAQKSGLDLKQKYKLLQMQTENLRLNMLLNHLENILKIVSEKQIINRIVSNDGYYQPIYNYGKNSGEKK